MGWYNDGTKCKLPGSLMSFVVKSSKPFVLVSPWVASGNAGPCTARFVAGTHLFPFLWMFSPWTYDKTMNPDNDFRIYQAAFPHYDDAAYLRTHDRVSVEYPFVVANAVNQDGDFENVAFVAIKGVAGWLPVHRAVHTPKFDPGFDKVAVDGKLCIHVKSHALDRLWSCAALTDLLIGFVPGKQCVYPTKPPMTKLHVKDEDADTVVHILETLLEDDEHAQYGTQPIVKHVPKTGVEVASRLKEWLEQRSILENLEKATNGNMCFVFDMSHIRTAWMVSVARAVERLFFA